MTARRSASRSDAPDAGPSGAARTVIVDANACFLPITGGIDVEREVQRWFPGSEVVTLSSVLGELDRLVEHRVRGAAAARQLATRWRTLATTGRGDSAIVRGAAETHSPVVTADRALQTRLREAGIDVLVPRSLSGLALRLGYSRSRRPHESATRRSRRHGIGLRRSRRRKPRSSR